MVSSTVKKAWREGIMQILVVEHNFARNATCATVSENVASSKFRSFRRMHGRICTVVDGHLKTASVSFCE